MKKLITTTILLIVLEIVFATAILLKTNILIIQPSKYIIEQQSEAKLTKQIAKGYKYQVDNNASLAIQIEAFRDELEKHQQQAESLGIRFEGINGVAWASESRSNTSYNGYSYEFLGDILPKNSGPKGDHTALTISVFKAPGLKDKESLLIFTTPPFDKDPKMQRGFYYDTSMFDSQYGVSDLTKDEENEILQNSINNFKDMMNRYLQYLNNNQ